MKNALSRAASSIGPRAQLRRMYTAVHSSGVSPVTGESSCAMSSRPRIAIFGASFSGGVGAARNACVIAVGASRRTSAPASAERRGSRPATCASSSAWARPYVIDLFCSSPSASGAISGSVEMLVDSSREFICQENKRRERKKRE